MAPTICNPVPPTASPDPALKAAVKFYHTIRTKAAKCAAGSNFLDAFILDRSREVE
jgi:hypothetical protein